MIQADQRSKIIACESYWQQIVFEHMKPICNLHMLLQAPHYNNLRLQTAHFPFLPTKHKSSLLENLSTTN